MALCLIEMQQFVLDTNFRNSLNNLNKHFKAICDLPAFQERCGVVRQGKKQLLPQSLTVQTEKVEKAINPKKKGK